MTIRQSAIHFTSDIAKLTENFTGRQWMFDETDRWLREAEERFFILIGEPGVGKSAIAAQILLNMNGILRALDNLSLLKRLQLYYL